MKERGGNGGRASLKEGEREFEMEQWRHAGRQRGWGKGRGERG